MAGHCEKRAVVILNASAGWPNKGAIVRQVRQTFLDQGWKCSVELVKAGADIGALCRRHIAAGAARIVAGGGDGTVRAVASAVAGTGVPMAVLPVGTLNHFARDLEIPLDTPDAIEVAGSGAEVAVDFADVSGRGFINNCVLGIYPAYRNQRDLREKIGWRKWSSITAAMLNVLIRPPRLALRFRSEGVEMSRDTSWVVIANNAHAMEGIKPWQRETLTGGDLWVYILRDYGRLALLKVVWKLLRGGSLAGEEMETVTARELEVKSRRRWIAISVDGEVMWLRSPLVFRSRSRDLRVVVPENSRRVAESMCELPGGVPSVP